MKDWNSQAAIVIVQEILRLFKKLWELRYLLKELPENASTKGGGSYLVSRISFSIKKDATTKETREAIWQLSVKI